MGGTRSRAWLLAAACAALLVALVAAGGPEATIAAAAWAGGGARSSGAALGSLHNSSSSGTSSSGSAWTELWAPSKQQPKKDKAQRLEELRAENVWKNDLVMWVLPSEARAAMPHALQVGAVLWE